MSILSSVPVDADYKMCSGWGRRSRKDLPTDFLHNQQVPFWICANGTVEITLYLFTPVTKTVLNYCDRFKNKLMHENLLNCLFPLFDRFSTTMQWQWWLGESPTHLGYLTLQVVWISNIVSVWFMLALSLRTDAPFRVKIEGTTFSQLENTNLDISPMQVGVQKLFILFLK